MTLLMQRKTKESIFHIGSPIARSDVRLFVSSDRLSWRINGLQVYCHRVSGHSPRQGFF